MQNITTSSRGGDSTSTFMAPLLAPRNHNFAPFVWGTQNNDAFNGCSNRPCQNGVNLGLHFQKALDSMKSPRMAGNSMFVPEMLCPKQEICTSFPSSCGMLSYGLGGQRFLSC